MRRVILVLMVAALICWACGSASAQLPPNPPENHYLVYDLVMPITVNMPLMLQDQFGSYVTGPILTQEKWGNPIFMKNGEDVIWDPIVHHVWYKLDPLPNFKIVTVEHQWGAFDLTLREAIYLINPADKFNQMPGWPLSNHYLCYLADGMPLEAPVTYTDQWGTWQNIVHEPFCFCNPVEKMLPDGTIYPIVEPDMHLTCYFIDPHPQMMQFFFDDQFGLWDNQTSNHFVFCFPSIKTGVVKSEESTWGKIKSLYAD